jgi:hypothetical protein
MPRIEELDIFAIETVHVDDGWGELTRMPAVTPKNMLQVFDKINELIAAYNATQPKEEQP